MGVLGTYKNNDYVVILLDDGTKIRYNDSDSFNPVKPESMDCKITNQCDMGCFMCHEDSAPDGKHGDILNVPFFDTLLPYTEIALGGGNPLSHPDLIPFLQQLKERKLIPNMTVNQVHFMKNIDLIKSFVDNKLIYGMGVSLHDVNDDFIETAKEFPNLVVHVINGLVGIEQLKKLSNNGLKILILGYKKFRRGEVFYNAMSQQVHNHQADLYNALPNIIEEGWFDCVSFDNLAIEQLEPKRLMSDEEYKKFYLGDDGFGSMYVDLVEKKFARSSVSTTRYDLENDIKTMFDKVRC